MPASDRLPMPAQPKAPVLGYSEDKGSQAQATRTSPGRTSGETEEAAKLKSREVPRLTPQMGHV